MQVKRPPGIYAMPVGSNVVTLALILLLLPRPATGLLLLLLPARPVVGAISAQSGRTPVAPLGRPTCTSRAFSSSAAGDVKAPQEQLVLPPLPALDDRDVLRESHGFSDEANWLVPGMVLLGRYPGSDPFLPSSPSEQLACLRDLVHRGGVSVFVCLQDEIPAQNDVVGWGAKKEVGMKGRHGFHWYAGDALAAASEVGRPPVRFVFFPASESGQAIQPMAKLHLLIQGLKHQVLAKHEVLYIHCWGGCGRTGIVAACLLGTLYHPSSSSSSTASSSSSSASSSSMVVTTMSADEAMAHVNSYFHLRSDLALLPHKRSPETLEQIQQVRDYFSLYLNNHHHHHQDKDDAATT